MATATRREVLQQLLTGLFQVAGAATVVLATGHSQASVTEEQKPLQEQNQPRQNLEQRVDEAVANAGNGSAEAESEAGFVQAFRNAGFVNGGFNNGGFRNAGFVNGGGGGGFRNGGFVNGGGGGGGFRNSAFRNF